MSKNKCATLVDVNNIMESWGYCDNNVVLANADYYYTKLQTEKLLREASGMTSGDVQTMISDATRTKADKSEVSELAAEVSANAQAILNRYTKGEVDGLLAAYQTKLETNEKLSKYTAIEGDVLSLNNENITI